MFTQFNTELNSYFSDHTPLSKNSIARMGEFRRANNMMGIYTNDLHRHIKELDSGLTPIYSSSYVPELRTIDKEAQKWKKKYNEAVNIYKNLQKDYRLSLYKSDGTFDITSWL